MDEASDQDKKAAEASAAAAGTGETAPEAEAPRNSLVGFILAPALLVLIAVGIVWLFWFLRFDRRSFHDYSVELRSPDKATRWRAALDLVDTNRSSPDVIPLLLEIIDSPNEEQTLVKTSWNPRDMLKTPEESQVNLRWYATAALGIIGGELANEKLLGLTSDADGGVRLYAVHGLARLRDPKAVPRLLEVLRKDEDGLVRATAAYALGEITDPQAVPALREAHGGDEERDVRWNAAIALARFFDPAGRKTLEEMVQSDNPATRNAARKALLLLDHP